MVPALPCSTCMVHFCASQCWVWYSGSSVIPWMKKRWRLQTYSMPQKFNKDNIFITFGSSPGENVWKAETTPIFTHTHLIGWQAPWWQVWLTIQPLNRSSPPLLEDLTCPMPVCPASECSFCVPLVFSALWVLPTYAKPHGDLIRYITLLVEKDIQYLLLL